ncbi:MAG TPA: glucose-1-phosphate adenylyltransferase [Clostridiaceae bacterium]|nr:glucose-1-phosphate adenylyltransferase [Clostridiaceae bacterium]
MAKQETIAMILAGGQGSRLGVLTDFVAKPAVPFGSRYRIIDFPLSNCMNSGIETVGVLTQYQPLELNSYIGNGHPWDLDRNSGGTFILPPYLSLEGNDWYKGTANAIYQNIPFIDGYDPRFVLILSGDHIYKMDYAKMVAAHIEKEAEATIAVIEVPWSEASRFGIMNVDGEGRVTEFEEKPAEPKSNLASMGVYCFSWEVLRRELIEDERNPKSENDFGGDVIPGLIAKGRQVYTYHFNGYWKDVGTVSSLWESNMDLLINSDQIDLRDMSWPIFSKNPQRPSHYFGPDSIVKNTAVTDGAELYGEVYNSVIGYNVLIEKGAVVRDSIIMPGVHIGEGAVLDRCIVGMNTVIESGVRAEPDAEGGRDDFLSPLCQDDITVIAPGLIIREGLAITGNSMIGPAHAKSHPDAVAECPSLLRREMELC